MLGWLYLGFVRPMRIQWKGISGMKLLLQVHSVGLLVGFATFPATYGLVGVVIPGGGAPDYIWASAVDRIDVAW